MAPEVQTIERAFPAGHRRAKRGPESIVDLEKTLNLLKAGLTYEEIGKVFGVGPHTISNQLNKYITDGIDLEFYKRNRADILASKGMQILKSVSQKDIEKASAYQRIGMYGILYDKERLERGQSTANIAYADMSRDLKEMNREIKRLEEELGCSSLEAETVDNPEG
jgi:transposase